MTEEDRCDWREYSYCREARNGLPRAEECAESVEMRSARKAQEFRVAVQGEERGTERWRVEGGPRDRF